jgi:putative ABC transport system ATP-binding protein
MSSNEVKPIVLEARGIVKELGQGAGKIVAVKGIDIALVPGELTLLMGPSGSGKTTLLSILGCILSPTTGTISIAGEPTAGLSPDALAKLRRQHIGYIFQSYNLFPTLSALENVKIALDVVGIKGAQATQQAEQALRDVGLGHKLKSYPANMSGGEKQRVAVARAIASAPSIVLADEPTAALDSENGHAVMKLLSEIAKVQNRSILVVTHDPRTLTYADRVIKIEDGLIVGEERTTATTKNTPQKSLPLNSHQDAPQNSQQGATKTAQPAPTLSTVSTQSKGKGSKRAERRKGKGRAA